MKTNMVSSVSRNIKKLLRCPGEYSEQLSNWHRELELGIGALIVYQGDAGVWVVPG